MYYIFVALTILLTVYGQLIIKWQVGEAGVFPVEWGERIWFLMRLVLNPWVISSFAAAFLAALSWMAAMTRLQLSHAYPFMSLSFVLVIVCSGIFFHEPITTLKLLGVALIVLGIIVGSQG
jgi:multidrug transporter EmrE-like cation transporter